MDAVDARERVAARASSLDTLCLNTQVVGTRGNLEAPVASSGRLFDSRRVFDITVTLIVLPVALLVGAITALAIFLDSPGPVFYRSTRVGLGGRTFKMLKFRKFHQMAAGEALTTSADERFTPIGRFLAVTKLDELPQLWNVLRGEMRLVGPRPEVAQFVDCYPEHYREILRVVPGITGPAALAYANESYLLGEHPDPVAFYRAELLPKKIDIDVGYVQGHSVAGDVAILARTAAVPIRQLVRRIRYRATHRENRSRHRHHGIRPVPLFIAGVLVIVSFTIASSSPL